MSQKKMSQKKMSQKKMSQKKTSQKKTSQKKMSQKKLILQYFLERPNQNIKHPDVVDWAVVEWEKQKHKKFRDPDRAIRKLHQEGVLIKVGNGLYRYDPDSVKNKTLEDFTAEQKRQILERDDHKCAVCGLRAENGRDLHVDHIKPKDQGGKAELENGQVLCATHNYRKKTYSQTESGKRMFINLLRVAKKSKDQELINFCEEMLRLYEKHDINGHIEWQ
jgi:predicted restriction endonuclease